MASAAPSLAPVAVNPVVAAVEPPKHVKPSFDCGLARSPVELLICKDEKLASQDAELSAAYRVASAEAADKQAVRQAQTDWMRSKRNRCTTTECISAAYSERLAELSAR